MTYFLTATANCTLDQKDRARINYMMALERVFLDSHSKDELQDLVEICVTRAADDSREAAQRRAAQAVEAAEAARNGREPEEARQMRAAS